MSTRIKLIAIRTIAPNGEKGIDIGMGHAIETTIESAETEAENTGKTAMATTT